MSAELDALKAARSTAERAYREACDAHDAARIAHSAHRIGDVIRSARGKEAKIVRVFIRYGEVTIRAVARKTNGEWGIREVPMYLQEWNSFTLVSRAGQSA